MTTSRTLSDEDLARISSRRIARNLPLDHVVPHERLGEVSLRWIYVHLIREHARHGGHADILREQLDGSVGA